MRTINRSLEQVSSIYTLFLERTARVGAFLITYDLTQPGQNYSEVHEAIKNCGEWWHYLESTWIIPHAGAGESAGGNDVFLVINVRRPADGWLEEEAWKWINTIVPF